jgi:hypothetical protein
MIIWENKLTIQRLDLINNGNNKIESNNSKNIYNQHKE